MQNVNVDRLSNELPLYIRRSKKSPIVTLQVWVRTGSADELDNEAGISHFIEHLVFKGTKSFKAGEIAQQVEAAGGELNAYTSFDQTVFYVTVPKKNLEIAAHVLSEMVSEPLFDPAEVENEREVVIEEIKMGLDEPSRVASKMLFSQMFEGYPYEHPVIGTQENIRRVTVGEIKDYFDERYVTENMSLVCVGDVDGDKEVKEILEKYFSKVEKSSKVKRDRKRAPRKLDESKKFKFQKSEFEKDHFYLSWATEGFQERNSEAYELLALLLGQGESSYLYKKLKLEKGLCRSIGASYFGSKEHGIFVISGVCMGDQFEKLKEELPEVLKSFLSQKDISNELEKAANIFSSEPSYASESLSSQCRLIGDDWLYYDEIGEGEKRKERVLLLNETDLAEASKRIFEKSPKLSFLSQNEPKNVDSFIGKLENLKSVSPAFVLSKSQKKEPGTSKTKTVPPTEKVFEWETKNKNKVVFVQSSESEVVSFKMGFQGGEVFSQDETQGLVSLLGSTWAREFKGVTEAEQALKMDYYCSGFDAFSGKHSIGLSLYTLKKFFPNVKDLFYKALFEAEFSENLLEREKTTKLQQLGARKDRPSSLAFKEFSSLMFKGTFYERDSIGEKSFIEKCQVEDLKKLLKTHIEKSNIVYTVVGDLTLKEIEDAVNEIEAELPSFDKNIFKGVEFTPSYKSSVSKIKTDKNQSHIVLGYPGLTYLDENKLSLSLACALLGGQGGRLFIELRDKASLAYSVAPLEHSGYFGGYFASYIACDPQKTELAISMMKEELAKVANEAVSPAELDWMKNQILGKQAVALQKNSFICDTILFDTLYGVKSLNYKNLEARVQSITAKKIQETMAKILSGPEFLVVAGD